MVERVLVTGATGCLGGAILRRLGPLGIGQGRDPARLARLVQEGFAVVPWSLPDPAPKVDLPDDIDTVVHCAALSAPFGPSAAFHRSNVLGTEAVLAAARARSVRRFVLISSPSVYFQLKDQLGVSEDMVLPPPFTPYAASKVAAEALVLAATDMSPVVLRPRGIYGTGDTTLLPRLLQVAQSRPLPRFRGGQGRIDLTFVADVVDAVLAAVAAGPAAGGQVFNISGGEVLPISDIVEQTCTRAGVTPRWRTVPLRPALAAARVAEMIALMRPGQPEPAITRYAVGLFAFAQSLDITRAREGLDWVPKVSFAEGLDRTFAADAAG